MAELVQYYGTGRRKSSVARCFLRPGTGKITVNGKGFEEYLSLIHISRSRVGATLFSRFTRLMRCHTSVANSRASWSFIAAKRWKNERGLRKAVFFSSMKRSMYQRRIFSSSAST